MRRELSARHGARGQRRRPDWGACPVGRVRGHPRVHCGTSADVGAHGRTSPRRACTSEALRRARRSPGCARGRSRDGRGWWASHHRPGRPRPARYGSAAPQAWQWRGRARTARRAIVAEAAVASSASALMHHPWPPRTGKLRRGNTLARCGRGASPSPYGLPRPGQSMHSFVELQERHSTAVLAMSTAHHQRQRHEVVDGQVRGAVARTLVARAPVPVLGAPGAEHAG
jgi:hypothetical protein